MAILSGVEVPDSKPMKYFARTNGLTTVEFDGKHYIGTLLTIKGAMRDNEAVEVFEKFISSQWHPRFLSYLQENVRHYTSKKDYVPSFRLIAFEYLNAKVVLPEER